MKPAARWALLAVVLVWAAYLALFGGREFRNAEIVQAEVPGGLGAGPVRKKPFSEPESILEIRPRLAREMTGKALFGATVWSAPAKPATAPATPPPSAPPIPFKFIGKRLEGRHWEVYVTLGDRTLILQRNETFDGTYRVESIEPPDLVLTYLPLNQRQILNIGSD